MLILAFIVMNEGKLACSQGFCKFMISKYLEYLLPV